MPTLLGDPDTDLVPIDPHHCPNCGQPTDTLVTGQPALLRHGGYGATRTTTTRHCPCGWTLVADVTETNPRR